MTRNARTNQFRKKINEEYVNNIISEYNKTDNTDNTLYKLHVYVTENFYKFYDNVEMVEKLDKLGLIVWQTRFIYNNYVHGIQNNVTMEYLEKYPMKNWNWVTISYNANIELYWLEKHPEWNWDWSSISCTSDLASASNCSFSTGIFMS